MVRGQLVSPTATLVVGEVERLALGKHLESFETDQFFKCQSLFKLLSKKEDTWKSNNITTRTCQVNVTWKK